jgi:hypothetical protein
VKNREAVLTVTRTMVRLTSLGSMTMRSVAHPKVTNLDNVLSTTERSKNGAANAGHGEITYVQTIQL